MTCCLIAMMLLAHLMAVVRRWGMFWGLVQVPEGADYDTAYTRLRRWLARPPVRRAAIALVAAEALALGGWVYAAHGEHFYRIGDQAIGRLKGQTIVYAEVCGSHGDRTVRLVIGEAARPAQIVT